MPYASSPGINFTEIDLTASAIASATSTGAVAGPFSWGPAGIPVLVDQETTLVDRFGKPTDANYETWFSGASFLAYSKSLQVTRAIDDNTFNAVANTGTFTTSLSSVIRNDEEYDTVIESTANFANTAYVARYPGIRGNSLLVSQCDSATAFSANVFVDMSTGGVDTANVVINISSGSNTAVISTANAAQATLLASNTGLTTGSILRVGNNTIGTAELRVSSITTSGANVNLTFSNAYNLSSNLAITTSSNAVATRYWEFYRNFAQAPGTSEFVRKLGGSGDELHIVVVDRLGLFTGVPGQVLERFSNVSRATDGKMEDGTSSYYVNRVNTRSQYMWWSNHVQPSYTDTAANIDPIAGKVTTLTFNGGTDSADESTIDGSAILQAYDTFSSTESIFIDHIIAGKARSSLFSNYMIDNIAEVRKDCVVYVSPPREAVVANRNNERDDIVTWRNTARYSSYVMYDTGYKQVYDKYNDVYRWVPLNGDIAGLAARTASQQDAWWSPAGVQRGMLKNVVKLAYNPNKADRDVLYRYDVNPVVSETGTGTYLNGDKTGLGRDSAFSRVNVRWLFIILEKTIVKASKSTLFEFNDDFTRAQFRNLVEPFLRDVQGRRGIKSSYVLCDETNNTDQVVMSNSFVGSIFVKPNYSINNMQLNFVATPDGVAFETIIGNV